MKELWVALLAIGCGSNGAPVIDASVGNDQNSIMVDAASPVPDASDLPALTYTVIVSDPNNLLPGAGDDLKACAEGGLAEWAKVIGGLGTLTVQINVMDTAVGRFAGASTSNVPAGDCKNTAAPCHLVEEQAIHRLRTGDDNPAMTGVPDVHVDVSPDYWTDMVWVDPDPIARTATVPPNRLDCVSLFTHELGHALGMTGFRALDTFQPTGQYQSLYDDYVVVGTSTLTFNGPLTVADFGPVPLTRTNPTQNVYHYGDPAITSPLDTLLMNGVSYQYGHRYHVTKIDARIVQDLGVPVRAVPAQ